MRTTHLRNYLLLAFCFCFGYAQAGSGGPDTYGYSWIDSNEPGLSYSWVDITGLPGATQVTGLADDNAVGPFNIGWDFRYYWQNYNTVKVGSNGWVSFDNVGNIASCFPTIPTAGGAGDNIVSPYMSDLNFLSSYPNFPNVGEMWYWSNNVDSFVIQWVDVPWWANAVPDWTGSNTFQMVLSGQDSSIVFNYMDTDAANFVPGTACPTYMEVGIENLTGNIGLGVFSGTTLPSDTFSIKFDYPGTVVFQVPDATPAWNANADNAGQFYFINDPIDMQTNIGNVGNTDITNSIDIAGNLQSLSFSTVWSDNASIATGVTAGNDSTIVFANQATITSVGQYYYNISTTNSQDINFSNNNNTVEISAIENVGGRYNLTYATLNNPDGSISWAGGGNDDGVAVKYVPPSYPYTIDSIRIWIFGDDQDPSTPVPVGFKLALYDAIGSATPLLVDSLTPAMIVEDGWNSVALSTPVTISSGDVYVAWLQGGTGVAIGTEAFGPISRRTYEILGGAWAPYRQNTVEDMLVELVGSSPVSIEDPNSLDKALTAYPNPVRGLLNVDYEVSALSDVNFSLLNPVGQMVWRKTHSQIPTGKYNFNIETNNFSSGVYFLNMEMNGERVVKKIVVE